MRFPRLGALCWIAAAPLFLIVQLVTGLRWRQPSFSWSANNISDLGNLTCRVWDTTRPRYVCSPWHDVMNAGMVLTAVLLLAGLALVWPTLGDGRAVRAGRRMVLLGAVGFGMVGLFPADTHENLHMLAAVLIFAVGNAGVLLVGWDRLRVFSVTIGLIGLIGVVLFFMQEGLFLGVGGMERVAVFPLPVWAAFAGVHGLMPPRLGGRSGDRRPRVGGGPPSAARNRVE